MVFYTQLTILCIHIKILKAFKSSILWCNYGDTLAPTGIMYKYKHKNIQGESNILKKKKKIEYIAKW